MGCCSYKQQQSILNSSQSSIQRKEDELEEEQGVSQHDINFFLNIPHRQCQRFIKYAKDEKEESDKLLKFYTNYIAMLNIFSKIIKRLLVIQKNNFIGLDSDILANSGGNGSQPQVKPIQQRNSSNLNIPESAQQQFRETFRNSLVQATVSPTSRRGKLHQKQDEQSKIVDAVVQKHAQYIEFKHPEVKVLLHSCTLTYDIQRLQTPQEINKQTPKHQLQSIKLKVSVFYNGMLFEGKEYQQKCPHHQSPEGYYDLKKNLDFYVQFLLGSKQANHSDQEFAKDNYILFEIFTMISKNSEHVKIREQKIPFEELLSQNMVSKTLKFFRDDMNQNSQIIKFDLELSTQLIHKQKQYLKEIQESSSAFILYFKEMKQKYQKKLKSNNHKQTQSNTEGNEQTNCQSNIRIERLKSFVPLEHPAQIFQNLFLQSLNSPSYHSKITPNPNLGSLPSSLHNCETQREQSHLSGGEFQESYSCQFQNQYVMKEDEDEDDDDEVIEDNNNDSNNLIEKDQSQNIDSGNETELFLSGGEKNKINITTKTNADLFKRKYIQSTDNYDEVDQINRINEQIKENLEHQKSTSSQRNNSAIKIQQCPIIEIDEKSSVDINDIGHISNIDIHDNQNDNNQNSIH